MKKLLLITILLFSAVVGCMTPKVNNVTVTNADEFIAAIASNTNITIKTNDVLDLIPALNKLDDSRELRRYDIEVSTVAPGAYFAGYDRELVFVNIHNLTINGESAKTTHMQSASSNTNVLRFVNCSNVTIRNIKAGHTERGECSANVVSLEKCKNVTIENCDLYGCGYDGIYMEYTNDVTVNNTEIRDCSDGMVYIWNCNNVIFNECYMHNCYSGNFGDRNTNVQYNKCNIVEGGYEEEYYGDEEEYYEEDYDEEAYSYIMPNPVKEWLEGAESQIGKHLGTEYVDGVVYKDLGSQYGSVIFPENDVIGAFIAEFLFNEGVYVFNYLDRIDPKKGEKMLFGNGHVIAVKQEGTFSYEIKDSKLESVTQVTTTSDGKKIYRHGKTKDSLKDCTDEVAKPHLDFETTNVEDIMDKYEQFPWGVG